MNKRMWITLLEKARKSDAKAQLDVGVYYEEGVVDSKGKRIVVKDAAKAVHWYRLAAEQGNSEAQAQLGVCFSTGIGIRRDLKQALSWTTKAFAQGSSLAAHNLATIYRDMGQFNKAFELYNRAVAMGELDSLLEVGLSYYYGIGTTKNPQSARKCFQRIAKANPTRTTEATREDANYMLGVASLEGKDIKQSISKARSYFELADKDDDHRAAQLLLWMTGRKHIKQ